MCSMTYSVCQGYNKQLVTENKFKLSTKESKQILQHVKSTKSENETILLKFCTSPTI